MFSKVTFSNGFLSMAPWLSQLASKFIAPAIYGHLVSRKVLSEINAMKLSNTFGMLCSSVSHIVARRSSFSPLRYGYLPSWRRIPQLYSIDLSSHAYQLITILLIIHIDRFPTLCMPNRTIVCSECDWSELLRGWYHQCW